MIAIRLFVFLGAFLLFTMEPMVGRLLLPHFGGAFHVWTTSLMFFQGVLFLAYAYAHLVAPRVKGAHLALLFVPLVALPPTVVVEGEHGVLALLSALTRASALPFFVLATTSVVAQRWLSESSLKGRENPYWLYATSNVGSLVALLAYALLVEPLVGVSLQRMVFTSVFALWTLSGIAAYRATHRQGDAARAASSAKAAAEVASAAPADAPIPPSTIVYWLMLSACPSAMLMGVTNLIALDAGNVPLVWVIPLALYLLTFVLAFEDPQRVPDWVRRLWPHFAAVALFISAGGSLAQELRQVALNLVVFFVIALAVHAELYATRPAPKRLTLFYLVLSLGGWLGGAFVSLVAPQVFYGLAEYPIAIVLVMLTILAGRRKELGKWFKESGRGPVAVSVLLIVAIVLQLIRGQVNDTGEVNEVARGRSFYGVYHVFERPTQLGPIRDLVSGITRHGRQFMDAPNREAPLSYYHREGSLGQVMEILRRRGRPRRVAAIGLGVGAAAAYMEPGESMTFFEIDPLDVELAREHFHYLEDCRGDEQTIVGDARVTLEEMASSSSPPVYDLILVDAFAGDAIPTHLVTREATELYFRLLAEDGYLLFHVSNRYYDLRPVLSGIARALDRPAAWRRRMQPTGLGEDPSEYFVFPPSEADLEAFDAAGWTRVSEGGIEDVDLWTDDRTNTLSILNVDW